MQALFSAIMTKFSGSSLSTNLVGRMYASEAKQGVSKPYGVFSIVSNTVDYTFDSRTEDILLQFNLVSESRSVVEINSLFEDLKTLYDDCILTVSGYSHVKMERDFSYLMRDAEENEWNYAVQYRIWIHA